METLGTSRTYTNDPLTSTGTAYTETPKETPKEIAERYYEDEVSINAFINGYKLAKEEFKNK